MRKLLVLVLVPVLLLVGCSSDDDGDQASGSSTTAEPSGTITTEPTVPALSPDEIDDATPYCATWKEIRSHGGPQTQGMTDGQAAARRKEFYGRLLPVVERLLTQAPEEIKADVQLALDNTRDAATTGSFDSFRTEESKEGARALAQYALDHCRKR